MKSLAFGFKKNEFFLPTFLYLLTFTFEWWAWILFRISWWVWILFYISWWLSRVVSTPHICILVTSIMWWPWIHIYNSWRFSWSSDWVSNYVFFRWISLGWWVIYLSLLFLFDCSLLLSGLRTLTSKFRTLGLCRDLENCLMVFGFWFLVLGGQGWSFVVLAWLWCWCFWCQCLDFCCALSGFLQLSFFSSSFSGINNNIVYERSQSGFI